MSLLAPLGLLGLLSVPLIVAFYMLRLRRDERPVSSTFLWQQLVRDVEANAPWQRLRRSLLLLVQLLLAILLVAIVARPVLDRPAGLAHDLVVVVDASASMSATDVFPDRLTAAKAAAVSALGDLPSGARVSVIAAADTARVVANEATDSGRAARAISAIGPSTATADLSDALKLAGALAARARDAQVLVVTDDAGGATPDVHIGAPIRVITVGRERANQAIAALAVRADPSGLKRTLFVSVANYADAIVPRRLEIIADGVTVSARDLQLDALSKSDVVIDELPHGTHVVEARLAAAEDGNGAALPAPADLLPLDDRAWAIVPDDRVRRVLLVGPGNVYLQNALTLLPNVELYGATPDQWPSTTGKDRFDLVVFDGFLPDELPAKPMLAIAPPRTSPLGSVVGTISNPAIGPLAVDEPLLASVDLSRLHVAQAQQMTLPGWARTVIPSGSDAPLLYSGVRDGLPTAVLTFDLRQSDLPLQVAWPILLSNVAGELLGTGTGTADPIAPATPVELALRPGVDGLRVTLPDASFRELAAAATGAGTLTFVDTHQLGVYRVEDLGVDPVAVDSPVPTPAAASASPGSSPLVAHRSSTPPPTPVPTASRWTSSRPRSRTSRRATAAAWWPWERPAALPAWSWARRRTTGGRRWRSSRWLL